MSPILGKLIVIKLFFHVYILFLGKQVFTIYKVL
jgi:hypothetical protein